MSTLRKAVKKTLIETDTTKKLLEALTDHDPKEIIMFMAKNTPRTLVDILARKKEAEAPKPTLPYEDEDDVYSPGAPMGRTDWGDIKTSLEKLYETGEYTYDDLITAAMEMTDGGIDRYTAGMLVDEIFE